MVGQLTKYAFTMFVVEGLLVYVLCPKVSTLGEPPPPTLFFQRFRCCCVEIAPSTCDIV